MTARQWERVTGAAGIAWIVLVLAELFTWGNQQFTDPLSNVRDHYVSHGSAAQASIGFAVLGILPLLVFASGLRAVLRLKERDEDVLSSVFLTAAAAFASAQIVFAALNGALFLNAPQATDSGIRLLVGAVNYLDAVRFMPFAVMVGAASLAMIEGRSFARWIGWLGVVSGVLTLVGEVGLFDYYGPIGKLGNVAQGGLLLFLIWAIAVSITLLRRPVAAASRQAALPNMPGVSV